MKKVSYVSLILLFGLAVPLATALAAPGPKVDVCHLRGNGTYILINISENALPAHLEHGDVLPGEEVPDMSGMVFADDCSMVNVVDVTGTWEGESGISGVLGYEFTMTISQEPTGVVTGTIQYTVGGILRYVLGTIAGYQFSFRTYSDQADPTLPYWADCGCAVSVDGSYFEGLGTSSSNQNIQFIAHRQ